MPARTAPHSGLLINLVQMLVDRLHAYSQSLGNFKVLFPSQALDRHLSLALRQPPGLAQVFFVARPSRGRAFYETEHIALKSEHSFRHQRAMDFVVYSTYGHVARQRNKGLLVAHRAVARRVQLLVEVARQLYDGGHQVVPLTVLDQQPVESAVVPY